MIRFSRVWFSIGFCIAYVALFALDRPLFRYYPLTGRWSLYPLADDPGPAMQWYGLVAGAAIAGGVMALVLSDRQLPDRVLRWVALVPLFAMTACLYLLRDFFIVAS